MKILDQVLFSEDFIQNEPNLACEAWFLAVLHLSERKEEALANIKASLSLGGRSFGWDFSKHIELSLKKSWCKVPIEWLTALDEVISKGRDLSILDGNILSHDTS